MFPMATCYTCDMSKCASCIDVHCGSCQDPRYLHIFDSATGAGICPCNPGYVEIGDVCVSCNPGCALCGNQDPNNCSLCVYGYKLVETSCVKVCYMLDPSDSTCTVCPEGCDTCFDSQNCSKTICDAGLFYFENTCLANCLTGTFGANVSNVSICQSCPDGCSSCDNSSVCGSCVPNYYLNTTESICKGCHPSCETCTSSQSTDCLTCPFGVIDATGACPTTPVSLTCNISTFYDSVSGTCVACSSGCEVCSSPTNCLKCSKSRYQSGTTCVACATIRGFAVINGTCGEICGDGIKINSPCDDKNTDSGDGCSSNCLIE